MTRQNSLTKHTFVNGKLFRFNMKQHWPFAVGAAILLLIVMIIPAVIELGSVNSHVRNMQEYGYTSAANLSKYIFDSIGSFVHGDSILTWIAMFGLAVVAGCVSLRFLNKKVGVNFWHSVPVRRETLLCYDFLTYLLYTVITYAAAFAVQMLVLFSGIGMYVTAEHGSALFLMALKGFGVGLLMYLYVYAVMILAAALCGTDFMRIIAAGVIALYPIILFLSVVLLMSEFATYTDWTALVSFDVAGVLAPIVRLFTAFSSDYPFPWYAALFLLLWSAVMLAVAVILYRRRKSEKAEQPMLYRAVAGVIKYTTMLIATILCGLLMRGIGGTYFWMVIGFILGALISFMIINAIFAKSAKAMFKPFRGFVIFAIVFAVLFVIFPLDIIGLDSHIPVSGVSSIEFRLNGIEYHLEGEEAEKALLLCRDALREGKENPRTYEKETGPSLTIEYPAGEYLPVQHSFELFNPKPNRYDTMNYSLQLTVHPSFGIPKIMNFVIGNEYCQKLIALAHESGEWRSETLERLSHAANPFAYFPLFSVELRFQDTIKGVGNSKTSGNNQQIAEVCRLLLKTADQPSGHTLGYIYDNAAGVSYPLYESDAEAVLYILHNCKWLSGMLPPDFSTAKNLEDLYRIAAEQFWSVVIYDWEKDMVLTVRDPAEILALTKQFGDSLSYGNRTVFDPDIDSERYTAIVTYDTEEIDSYSSIKFDFQQFRLPINVTLPAGEWVKAQH